MTATVLDPHCEMMLLLQIWLASGLAQSLGTMGGMWCGGTWVWVEGVMRRQMLFGLGKNGRATAGSTSPGTQF